MPCSGRVTTASKRYKVSIVELEFDSALVCNKGSFKQDPLDLFGGGTRSGYSYLLFFSSTC
jgi:hypothetical protein